MPRGRSGGSFANTGRMSGGGGGGFHYNFGIAIAASAVRDMRLFSGSALGLTAAIYALGRVSSEFVDTVKQNTLAFGGQLKTMNAMIFAQKQLLAGATEFGTQDIMSGMHQLMQVGVNARKEFKFVSDAAEATGQSFTSMSGVINQAIQGNMQGMVQMGLMTERASRNFLRFPANTIQRQAAIMNFLHNNQALQSAITQNFNTVAGQWRRILEFVKMFAQSILGNPRDPSSLYARVRDLIKSIADWMNKHSAGIRKAGAAIGAILGWVVKQVGYFVKFVGRQVDKVIDIWDNHMGNFKQRMWSLLLWLELWKVHIVAWIKAHKKELIGLLKTYLAFRGINAVIRYWGLFSAALLPVITRLKAIKRLMIWQGVLPDTVGINAHKAEHAASTAKLARQQAERRTLMSQMGGLNPYVVTVGKHKGIADEIKNLDKAMVGTVQQRQREVLMAKSRRGIIGRGFRSRKSLVGAAEAIGKDVIAPAAVMSGKGLLKSVTGIFMTVGKLVPMWGWILLAAGLIATQWDKIKDIIMPIVDQVIAIGKNLWEQAVPAVEGMAIGFAKMIRSLGPILVPILKFVGVLLVKALQVVGGVLSVIYKIIGGVADGLVWYFGHWVDLIKASWDWLKRAYHVISDLFDATTSIGVAFSNWFLPPGLMKDITKVGEVLGGWKKFFYGSDDPNSTFLGALSGANTERGLNNFVKQQGQATLLPNAQPWFGKSSTVPNLQGMNPFQAAPNFSKATTPSVVNKPVMPSQSSTAETVAHNPMIRSKNKPDFEGADFSEGVTVQSGAVQIIVQKGQNIDERKLADMVDRILPDLIRKAKLQQGK